MPLHLLPKKSWNVYSPANIERVRRDEAEAQRKAIEQEKRERQDEADERLQILKNKGDGKYLKRKLPGEDDTDRDIRLAVEAKAAASECSERPHKSKENKDVPLVDGKGHFSLVQAPSEPPPQKRPRVEEDPYTVYLSHATGRDRGKEGESPWYTTSSDQAWGDTTPRQKQRETARLAANDPLAAMKRGVRALRENEKQKKDWMDQREKDLREVEDLARESQRRRRNDRREGRKDGREELFEDKEDVDSLDGFNLDEGFEKHRKREHRGHRHHDHEHHRHRHRPRDDELGRSHHGQRHDTRERRNEDRHAHKDDDQGRRHRRHRRDHEERHSSKPKERASGALTVP